MDTRQFILDGNGYKIYELSSRTERIEFDDTKDWWEYRTFLSVQLEREWMPKAFSAMVTDESGELQVNMADPDVAQKVNEVNDLVILHSTSKWSYGDISAEVLHNEIPSHHMRVVVRRLSELYIPLLEKSIRDWLSDFSLLSNGKSPSLVN